MLPKVLLARVAACAPGGRPGGTIARADTALLAAVLAARPVFLSVGRRRGFGLVSGLLSALDAGDPCMQRLVDAPEIGATEGVEGFDTAVGIHRGFIGLA